MSSLSGRLGDPYGSSFQRSDIEQQQQQQLGLLSSANEPILIDDDPPEMISLLSDDEDDAVKQNTNNDVSLIGVNSPAPASDYRNRLSSSASHSVQKNDRSQMLTEYGAREPQIISSRRLPWDTGSNRNGYSLFLGNFNTIMVDLRQISPSFLSVNTPVTLMRDRKNIDNRNAIMVLDGSGSQIGSLPRHDANQLAPLIDRGDVKCQAIISGSYSSHQISVQVKLYTYPQIANRVRDAVILNSIPLTEIYDRVGFAATSYGDDSNFASQNAENQGFRNIHNRDVNIGVGTSQQPLDLDAYIANVKENFNITDNAEMRSRDREFLGQNYGVSEEKLKNLPSLAQPSRIRTQMLQYQLQGLAWLVKQEHPNLAKDSKVTTQFWEFVGNSRYYNRLTKRFETNPKLASGGCLADDMGLGKTIQLISLICTDPSVAISKGLIKSDTTPEKYKKMPTLILAPVSLMSNWSGQIASHVDSDSPLRVLVWHGSGRKVYTSFTNYDVVIASYGGIVTEYKKIETLEIQEANMAASGVAFRPGKVDPRQIPLLSQPWRRIILDEGHQIRNPNTKIALGLLRVDAYSRWILTGTPIINSLQDLYSLIRFIGLSGGLQDKAVFDSVITRGFHLHDGESETRLQALMSTITLRRLKSMTSIVNFKLPDLNEYIHAIPWTKSERRYYDAMEQEAKTVVRSIRKAQEERRPTGTDGKYAYLFEILLRLRQICNHKSLCGSRLKSVQDIEHMDVVEPTTGNILALQTLLQVHIDNDEECAICYEKLHNPRITFCKHVFGLECIEETIKVHGSCPMCRRPLTDTRMLVAPIEETKTEETVIDDSTSSKFEMLMKILLRTQALNRANRIKHEKPVKTVVFSQWTSFLDLIEPRLQQEHIGYARIDGSMKVPERDSSIAQLNNNSNVVVLLASLSVSATGLNLTAASQVIMCDLWWNVALERQAVDRCYRLGQTRPVNVFRLVMENSVEQRVIAIQDEKVELVERALKDGKRPQKSKAAQLADIERLLTSD
ncbi:SNF2 family N-terminal domain-containing protein, partial [Dipodascopsis uninucleata]